MDNRNAQMSMEGSTKALETQPSPGLRTTRKRAGVEPTISGVSQVMFPDPSGIGSGKQPSASGGLEKRPGHREASEEGPPELKTQEQRSPARPGKMQLSWAPQEGSGELQAGQDQAKPQSELGLLPSRVLAAAEGLQQLGLGRETEDQQGRQRNSGTAESQPLESCQQGLQYQFIPGHQAANGPDMVQPTELCCTLDSYGQPLGDEPPKEVGLLYFRPQGALPKPGPGGHEDSSQEVMFLMPVVTPEGKSANPFLPSTPGPRTPKEE
ncbi:PREDICTED: spermatogenesis-associated protein 21-like [Galeopterus variegatus]|uniref:Spermatogenesis-associated protein 21-like n=1 Tax=Galeopterus variegatus TaxID=482537 RepID=A0ABM0RKI8_GALVR|nr:PREDICTED: spermatogenesis-associated protein 21-like [Galeopterus variegatus]